MSSSNARSIITVARKGIAVTWAEVRALFEIAWSSSSDRARFLAFFNSLPFALRSALFSSRLLAFKLRFCAFLDRGMSAVSDADWTDSEALDRIKGRRRRAGDWVLKVGNCRVCSCQLLR